MGNVWGEFTLAGSPEQQKSERYWRHKVSELRRCFEASDVPAALSIGLGATEIFERKDRKLIEAALDGVDQETVADFIFLLMWRIQGEIE